MKISAILRKYHGKYIDHGGEFLFHPTDAISFLDDITRENIGILGIDMWQIVIVDGKEYIKEESSAFLTGIEDPAQIARSFLTSHLPPDIKFVSFVLDD